MSVTLKREAAILSPVDVSDQTSNEQLEYGILAQNALRGVVREVLRQTQALSRAPGEHHFYITFDVNADGVEMSDALSEQFPEEMTIVLQHQFWDLEVYHDFFSVLLKFKGTPEKLVVPFEAITKFFDPHVQFGLQFDVADASETQDEEDGEAVPADDAAEPTKDDGDKDASADVVSLDSFRKK